MQSRGVCKIEKRRRFWPHHPRRRQGKCAVAKTNGDVFNASILNASTCRGHLPSYERMEPIENSFLARQNAGAMSLS